MGEVYKARDPRLGRQVAIKVLPALFSADTDRLRRFEQEARAAGILNHPNITAVYDVGSYDGSPYVVQELLEGETLRSLLAGGRLSPRRSIDYASQIAKGLAAAHDKGIVHRDLKPENLFVTKDGRVKILDFGLAKLTKPEGSAVASSLPTATEPGVVMGTLGYMSPEQVKARPADARSDIFALGAILYEMLSGNRAFRGDSAGETMAAILKEDPPELSFANQHASPGVERIVRHCLEKDPERRFQSASDIAFDLEVVSDLSAPSARSGLPAGRTRRKASLALTVALLIAAVTAGVLGDRAFREGSRLPIYRQVTFRQGSIGSARFGPDGHTIIFAARWDGNPSQIFVKRPESPDSIPLSVPSSEILAVSSTGEMALALNCRSTHNGVCSGTLAQVPITGGSPRELQENVQQADWSPGGAIVLVHDVGGRALLEFPPGKVLYETSGHISYPRVSPKGDRIAFLDHPLVADDQGSVAVIDLHGTKTTLSPGWRSIQGLAWSASGEEVWFTSSHSGGASRSLYAVTLSGRQREVASAPGGVILRDVSRNGRVLLTEDSVRVVTAALAPGETRERDLSWLDYSVLADLSDDGTTILFDEESEGAGPNYTVCLRKTDGSSLVRLGEGLAEAISPDGQWVLARLPNEKASDVLLPTGIGKPRTLPVGAFSRQARARWFPDGKRVLFAASEPGRQPRLWVQSIVAGKARPITPEGFGIGLRFVGPISPDGGSVVAQGRDGRSWIFPSEGGNPRLVPAIIPGKEQAVRWSADGKSLFIRDAGEVPVRISQLNLETGEKTFLKEIAPSDLAGVGLLAFVALSGDAQAHAYSYQRILSDLYLVDGLR
jgi:serine/threonine protein kinase/Tol biopolymer transport system component